MLNLDTHMLVALLAGDLTREEHACLIGHEWAISDIVFWELTKLIDLGRIELDLNSPEFQNCLRKLRVIPISMEIARRSCELDFSSDPADEIIAATSCVEKIPLLTRDRRIRKSRMVPLAL
ncbi:MAG: PIN domain-containing protein [Terriglobia bacterium]|jgi:PIN domain nuclease of toxin-antitoxin system